ncbi:thioredoxin reductase [Thermoplasmatales archaeon SG8-52-4]|nr:MAG: thioredoxin reductase [Thermoplasmatales archaeon SG8-52-4]
MKYELAIIGAGPSGYSAAIYAVRSGIKAVIFDKGMGGGLANISPKIENYPGFESISGMELMKKMKKHAEKYVDIHINEEVLKIEKLNEEFQIVTNNEKYTVKALILCMGTDYRKLNAPGEKELTGKGVSYCATCDGFFFKDKKVVVIGGGNTALIEAIFLKQIGCKDVFVVHRRDQLRAEKSYEEEALKSGVQIIYNTHVKSIKGTQKVESIEIQDVKTNKGSSISTDGVFISIGEEPQNKLAKELGVKLDDNGFIITDKQQRTNVKGVYASGDITGGLRQVVTACAKGAVAALSSTEVLGKKYPY